jgi:hypothetical protein
LEHPETEAWPQLVRDALAADGGPVELVHRRFFAHAPGATAFLDGLLAAFPADWVVLQATAYQLTRRMATNRLERKFGQRAARAVEASPDGLHWLAVRGGRQGLGLWRSGVWLARKTIGAEGLAEFGPLTATYSRAIAQLARLEASETLVIGTGQPRAAVAWTNRAAPAIVRDFNSVLSEAARERRIPWIDHDSASPPDQEFESTFVDLFHKDAAWHRGMAAAVLAMLDPVVNARDTEFAHP